MLRVRLGFEKPTKPNSPINKGVIADGSGTTTKGVPAENCNCAVLKVVLLGIPLLTVYEMEKSVNTNSVSVIFVATLGDKRPIAIKSVELN